MQFLQIQNCNFVTFRQNSEIFSLVSWGLISITGTHLKVLFKSALRFRPFFEAKYRITLRHQFYNEVMS